ncbi:hypothetical protein ACJIZ3_004887 [Penstemon smallii]|uniref:Uncharacterized protein n=1 Tax=Penstemon smallii TaxID=265156 RepID=A0ABD3S3F5_9LAMI
MGRTPCCDKSKVKKGIWSPEEDAILKNYLNKFGTGGNWIALPQKAGLQRCGKSCRLRWLNYLRPDIKHGGFTQDEENIICNLYNRIGSRWSVIASHLSGRTDNEIKNYWNSKIKKKLKATKTNSNTKTTTTTTAPSSSNVAAATSTNSTVDEVTNFPVPENFMANGLNANADQPVFLLEGFKYCSSVNNNTGLFSQTQQDSYLFNSPSFGMDENYGVKGFQMDEYSYEVLSNVLSNGSPLNWY